MVQAEPRAGGVHEAGHRAVLGAGCLCVQRPGSAQDSAALGAPHGPQPLPALKKAQGRGVWAFVARQLSRRSLPQHPACPSRWPHLPDCPLWGWTSGRQDSKAQGRATRPQSWPLWGNMSVALTLVSTGRPFGLALPTFTRASSGSPGPSLAASVLVLHPGSSGSSAHVFVHFKSVAQRPSWVHPPHGASFLGCGLGCHVCPRNMALEGKVQGNDC